MTEEQFRSLTEQLYSELNSDKEHDLTVLKAWAERYREDTEAEPILKEIGAALFRLDEEDNRDLTEQLLTEAREKSEYTLSLAQRMITAEKYESALETLKTAAGQIDDFQLPENCVWMDFDRMLDALVYQDYFADEIGDREIYRHPLHPAELLFTYGSLLISMGRAEEAIEPLTRLMTLDPVSPRYLFELGEAYKRIGDFQSAYGTAQLALACAADNEELARCFRDMAYCLSESEAYPDAICLYKLSLRFAESPLAESELSWIESKTGLSPEDCGEEEIAAFCEQNDIPTDISQTVKENLEMLRLMIPTEEDMEEE